jgi:hypothetical protein
MIITIINPLKTLWEKLRNALIYQDKTPQKPDGKIKEKHHDSHFDSVLKYHLRKKPLWGKTR